MFNYLIIMGKLLIYIFFISWGVQIVNFILIRKFWSHFTGLLGLSKGAFRRLSLIDYSVFFFFVFIVVMLFDKFLFPIDSVGENPIILLILFSIFILLTVVAHLFMHFWKRVNTKRRDFNLEKYNKELIKNLENRNVLFVDQIEIEKKHNIARKGKEEKTGSFEKKQSIEKRAKFSKNSELVIDTASSSTEKIDYEVHEEIDLKLLNCISYYNESSQLKIYHLDSPTPIKESNDYKIREILFELEQIRGYHSWWALNYKKFELSNDLKNRLRQEMEEYLYNTYIKSSFTDNITGMIIVIGDFNVQIKNGNYSLSSTLQLEEQSIVFKLELLKERIYEQKINAFKISSDQTIKLIIFGWAREKKRQTKEKVILKNRDVEIITPIAVLE